VNRGIIITHERTMTGGLRLFALEYRPSRKPDGSTDITRIFDDNVTSALKSPSLVGIAWLSGPAATPRLAKKFNLEYRRRAPGAGRPAMDPKEKTKQFPLWMKPADIRRIKAAAKLEKVTYGECVASRFR